DAIPGCYLLSMTSCIGRENSSWMAYRLLGPLLRVVELKPGLRPERARILDPEQGPACRGRATASPIPPASRRVPAPACPPPAGPIPGRRGGAASTATRGARCALPARGHRPRAPAPVVGRGGCRP